MASAVKKDGKYVDATAIQTSPNPFNLQNGLAADVATIVRAYKKGEIDGEEYSTKIGNVIKATISVLASNSFAENIAPWSEAAKEYMNERSGNTASARVVGGLATSFVPAAVRVANQSVIDPMRRDTTGDKSFLDRVSGQVKAVIPGKSKGLPLKYDVYGRPIPTGKNISGVNNSRVIDADPTVQEIQRLEATTNSPVVTAPKPFFTIEGAKIKLTGHKYAEYQRISGEMFLRAMKSVTKMENWSKVPDDIKIQAIKELLKEVRDEAQNQLVEKKIITKDDITNLEELKAEMK